MKAYIVKHIDFGIFNAWVVAAPNRNIAISHIADTENVCFNDLTADLITSVVVTADILTPTILS